MEYKAKIFKKYIARKNGFVYKYIQIIDKDVWNKLVIKHYGNRKERDQGILDEEVETAMREQLIMTLWWGN